MKAYQVVENGKPLQQKEMETPNPTGKEILLKTVSCGVCHSDVHIHDGYFEPMDTYREYINMNKSWDKGEKPWLNF